MEPQPVNSNVGISPALPAVSGPAMPAGSAMSTHQQVVRNTNTGSTPVAAEDSDTIEQEWIAAVKRTLEQYKDDPYSLSRAMTALRQDYLQKRYGRTVEAAK